jgi:hypothetical protein
MSSFDGPNSHNVFIEKRNLGRYTIFEFVALHYNAID